jgi:hypothetical protein
MEEMMGENKGKGTKGRSYDELSGVGTSRAGVTGINQNLGDLRRDAGLGPDLGDEGNLQSANPEPAAGTPPGRQGQRGRANQQNKQGGQAGSSAGGDLGDSGHAPEGNVQGGSRSR